MADYSADADIVDGKRPTLEYLAWFNTVDQVVSDLRNSGPTSARPTTNMYIGKPYFDTTVGGQIHLRSINPTVWVLGNTPV